MSIVLVLLVATPLVAVVVCAAAPPRVSQAATAISGLVTLGLAVAIVPAATDRTVTALRYLRVDALSAVFVLATGFLYAVAGAYAIGYLAGERRSAADPVQWAEFRRYSRRFHLGLNVFAWSMVCAPLVNGLALLWIAIEVTTVVSALLVALDNTEDATEAAWKYVLLASCGLGIALLATILMYAAGSSSLGSSYDLAFDPLLAAAKGLPQTPVRLAFLLAVLGFGTKVGLVPVHTWLPDAHAQAPTPVSALLSGSLLATSFYAILRYFQITERTLGPAFPRGVLLVFGVGSLALAALYVLDQQDLKRFLAYSSVEHMGIIAIGVSFGGPVALAGVLLHVLAHAAAKGNAFLGAGVLVQRFGTRDLGRIRSAVRSLPWSAPLFVAAALALCAMPPFGLFRSEFQIVTGGLAQQRGVGAAVLVVLVSIAFLGITATVTRAIFAPAERVEVAAGGPVVSAVTDSAQAPAGEPSRWMVAPVLLGLLVLLVLGIHPPDALMDLINAGVNQLQGVAG